MDNFFGGFAWWCIGYGIAYGNVKESGGITGTKYFFGTKWDDLTYGSWFF